MHAAGAWAPSIANIPRGQGLQTALAAVEARKVSPVHGAHVVEEVVGRPAPGAQAHDVADVAPAGANWYAPQAEHTVEAPDA